MKIRRDGILETQPNILVNNNGINMPVENDASIPSDTSGLLIAGKDEINVARFINVDGYGSVIVTGTGPEGTFTVSNAVTTAKTLYDIQDLVVYVGEAIQGSASNASIWLIKKTIFDGSGNPTSQTTSQPNVIWDNRAALTYS